MYSKQLKDQDSERKSSRFTLSCFICDSSFPVDDYGSFYYCKKCDGVLEIRVTKSDPDSFQRGSDKKKGQLTNSHISRGVWKYSSLIPIWRERNIVSMTEGETPLVECKNLAETLGLKSLFLKFEGLNPTGSFKDRGMTVGVSKAKELGFKRLICASTGNTSASLAAYGARANMKSIVLIPQGKVALGKVAQAVAYGAQIFQVEGNFDECLRMATEIAQEGREMLLLNSVNPFRIEGQKTAAFEITEQLGFIPNNVILPVGNGGNISSLWKGFKEIRQFAFLDELGNDEQKSLPKVIGVQAEGASPIARAFRSNAKSIKVENAPHTEATAINIGSPVNWAKALDAVYESDGLAASVSDDEIFEAQKLIASREGLFVEPASASPVAFLRKISSPKEGRGSQSREEYQKLKDSTIVCIATGNGLKDPNAVMKDQTQSKIKVVNADVKSLERALFVAA